MLVIDHMVLLILKVGLMVSNDMPALTFSNALCVRNAVSGEFIHLLGIVGDQEYAVKRN